MASLTFLTPLALLACPLAMVLMMVFMGKGMMGGKKEEPEAASTDKATVEELRAEQKRLAAEVERLERSSADRELAEQR